jgi:hypothetical protein
MPADVTVRRLVLFRMSDADFIALVAEKTSLLLITGLNGNEKTMFPIGTGLSTEDPNYRERQVDK